MNERSAVFVTYIYQRSLKRVTRVNTHNWPYSADVRRRIPALRPSASCCAVDRDVPINAAISPCDKRPFSRCTAPIRSLPTSFRADVNARIRSAAALACPLVGWRISAKWRTKVANYASGGREYRSSVVLLVDASRKSSSHGPVLISMSRPNPHHLPASRRPVGSASIWIAP
jgi:hypothetical protein